MDRALLYDPLNTLRVATTVRIRVKYITVAKEKEDEVTKAVGLVGYKCLAGVGYLAFST